MSLIWITESHEEETSEEQNRRTHTRYFRAKTGLTDDWQAILRGRPDLGKYQPHPTDPEAFVQRFNPRRRALGLWEITVEYSTEVQGETKENPLDRFAEVAIDNQPRDKVRSRDAKHRPIVNTAFDLFDDPPPVESVNNLVFTVDKNIPVSFPPWLLRYRSAVNSDVIRLRGLTLPPNSLKIQKLTIGKEDTENGIDFCVLHLEIEHDPDGWTTYIPNRGYNELVYDKGQNLRRNRRPAAKREILIEGAPAREPQWLDAYGQAVAEPWKTTDQLIFLPFDLSPQLPFNRLPLR